MININTRKVVRAKERAFTLAELLVVLAIISILATISISTLQSQRLRARDAKRKMDIDALRKAVELYYTDKGTYSDQDTGWCCIESLATEPFPCNSYAIDVSNYISSVPKDPLYPQLQDGTTSCYWYKTKDGGQQYKIRVILEESKEYYEVYSGGGKDIY